MGRSTSRPDGPEEAAMADERKHDLRDDRSRGLLQAYEDDGVAGRIAYFVLDAEPAALVAVHTVVEPQHEGRGIAGALVAEFYAMAAREGVPVVPLCPYAAAWAKRHPEQAPVAPAELVAAAEVQLRERPERW
ncbi:GNAT family N-acetyltransferase [Streptomyces sp. NPDC047315]|uniref:GNAT family N-acetyltransferase n=1 Tax=Streptomyces sp. NPDC047315 TaxID=3155142 RepID=UPI00341029DB